MDDPNNRRLQLIKEIPPSPSSEETTCASTVGTSSQHPNSSVARSTTRPPTSRSLIRRQLLQLGLASSGAMGVFVVSVVPINILIGITVVFLLWMAFFYRLFQMMQSEYQMALQGRGLGDFLPQSLYDQLVNISFHDFMSDGSFAQENQHFLLYFIPGITAEQRDGYIERLVPRHQQALQRPGLGNFLGEGFMRHVIGDEGLTERQEGTTRRLVPRRLEILRETEDAASRLGDDDDEGEDARMWGTETPEQEGVEVATRAAVIEAHAGLQISTSDSVSEESEDLAAEESVIFDAAVAGVMTYASWVLGFTTQAVSGSIVRTTGRAVQATVGIGAFTAGVGIFGIWAGFWTPQDLRMPSQMPREFNTAFVSSAIASSATAGLFMLYGYRDPTPPASKAKSGDRSAKKATSDKKRDDA